MSSAILSSETLAARPSGRVRLAVLSVRTRVVAFVKAVSNRRHVQDLLELDDRTLDDIGLERRDVARALGQPLPRDPSTVLMIRSVERRSRLRGVASPRRVNDSPSVETCS